MSLDRGDAMPADARVARRSHVRDVPAIALACLVALLFAAGATPAAAQAYDPNACDAPGDEPDIIVGELYEIKRWGHVGDITAFSVGTYSCNVGTCWVDWLTGGNQNKHPVIGGNMFRLARGRFEQVGQSWLKHGFYALSAELCTTGCLATDGEHLGVNCSDPYSADLNGTQTRLGPKFEVNVATGFHPHPPTDLSDVGDEVFKRLQVHDADLDPALNPGARYFVEGQYVAEDDRAAGNHHDNASYRPVRVTTTAGGFDVVLEGTTERTKPGIRAWKDTDPTVVMTTVDDPDDGRFLVAGQATDLGGGRWHYEYAVQNLDSQRAGGWYSVPLPPGAVVSNIGFHDVDYHSGEPYDLTDWTSNGGIGPEVRWDTVPHDVNPNANALRWGTLYNFRFDADRPPATGLVTIGLFLPPGDAETDRLVSALVVPSPCDGDGACDPGENCVSCPDECADAGPDSDGDGVGYCADCDDNSPRRWTPPGEVVGLMATRGPSGEVLIDWSPPLEPGATSAEYEALRSPVASDFATGPACLRAPDPTGRTLEDRGAPTAGRRLYYLVRARNTCGQGVGTTGGNSFGVARLAASCP